MDYMGIDHHKQYSHITLMDGGEKSSERARWQITAQSWRSFLMEGKRLRPL